MKTILYNQQSDIPALARLLQQGQAVGIPTETVYGLAANALDGQAVGKIFAAKNRPADNPLIVHISSLEQLPPLVKDLPAAALALAQRFWPGPLTIVLYRSSLVPDEVTHGGDTVAIRMPSHPDARAIIDACGLPLAAPSANRSGSPSPTTAMHVMKDMEGIIPAVFDGGECSVGVESTVVSLVGDVPRLLRPGGITPAQLKEVLGELEIDPSVVSDVQVENASSPGMKYKHYAPATKVVLVHGKPESFVRFANSLEGSAGVICFEEEQDAIRLPSLCLGSYHRPEEAAHRLFACLRQADDMQVDRVYAHCPPKDGMGLAVYNRLVRAAGFDERELDEQ